MSDETREVFDAMRELRKERHREWKRTNMQALRKHGLFGRITNNGECIVFSRPIRADFYPSTGRWRSGGKTYSGGAEKFSAWYAKEMQKVGTAI